MSRSRPNYISVILSVALVLLLVGCFAMTAIYGNALVRLYKEKVDIWLELKPDLAASEIARIVGMIRNEPFVKKESLTFITKEQAAATMRQDLGDEQLLEDLPNLMRDIVRFNVRAAFLTPDSLALWRSQITQDSAVSELYFQAIGAGNAEQNIKYIGLFFLTLAGLLIFGAIALIHNTIRLALYANRFVIKNQELVGASWSFITRPYIKKGIINGLVSAIIAIIVLNIITWLALKSISGLESVHNPSDLLAIGFGLLVLGALIGGLSTWWVVNKFLKMRLEDLY